MDVDRERADLGTSFRGYKRSDVDALLERIAGVLESLHKDIAESNAARASLEAELAVYKAQETTLKDTLVLAQKAADEARASAQREAGQIQEFARQRATDAQREAETKLNDLRWEIERLRIDRQKFINSFRFMLESQLRDLAEQGGLAVVEGDASGEEAIS